MTYFQQLFVKNLRLLRKQQGFSQSRFAELIDISPNYLNAVENGKNFPSPEVIQNIINTLKIAPFQLFSEHISINTSTEIAKNRFIIHELTMLKQKLNGELDGCIQKYQI